MSSKNRNLYVFWFGDEMSKERRSCYESIVKNSNANVVLVTDDNLNDFESDQKKYHDGLRFLSSTMKTDYLRAYFMYLYGGGYTDIKNVDYDWNPYFEMLENSDKQAIGYRELSPDDINYPMAKDMYSQIIGTGAFIQKRGSALSKEWLEKIEAKMDDKMKDLLSNPGNYHPRAIIGGTLDGVQEFEGRKYPFRFTELGGDIWHEVQVSNLGQCLFDLPYINMSNYR